MSSITFWDAENFGLFDFEFSDGQIVSLYGLDVGSNKTLLLGTYSALTEIHNATQGFGVGEGTVTLSDQAPVPEPATMLLFGTGIVGLVAARRKKKA